MSMWSAALAQAENEYADFRVSIPICLRQLKPVKIANIHYHKWKSLIAISPTPCAEQEYRALIMQFPIPSCCPKLDNACAKCRRFWRTAKYNIGRFTSAPVLPSRDCPSAIPGGPLSHVQPAPTNRYIYLGQSYEMSCRWCNNKNMRRIGSLERTAKPHQDSTDKAAQLISKS